MWCVAELDDGYIARMEDVLETYEKPRDLAEPVLCLDEKPVTLHADLRPSSPAQGPTASSAIRKPRAPVTEGGADWG